MIAAAPIRSLLIFLLSLTFLFAFAAVPPATATMYILVADEDLATQADVIVEARIDSIEHAPGERPATDALITVENVIHGFVPASSLIVRTPGGVNSNGDGLYIYGAPHFREGEKVLLMLAAGGDGTYAVLHFNQGAFRIVDYQGRKLLVRDLSEAERIDEKGRELSPETRVRDLERFSNFLAARASGANADDPALVDYYSDAQYEDVRSLLPRFNSMQDRDDGTPLRWTTFDGGSRVTFFAHEDGQPGISGGGFSEFQTALRSWTNEPRSYVQLRYGGKTSATGGLQTNDGINAILFNNKDNGADFDNPFSCTSGGTLALGGPWYRRQVHTHRGVRYYTIVNADVVMNVGVSCFVGINRRGEQVFAHEIGHCLGVGHSCGDNRTGPCNTTVKNEALMRAQAHNDNRGAQLGQDDQLAVCTIYGTGSCGDGPPAPGNLQAVLLETGEVELTWEDNANDETGYRVEVQPAGGSFSTLANLGANVTRYLISSGLTAGVQYTFRVRAVGPGGTTASNRATILFPLVDPPTAPTDLTAQGIGLTSIRLRWTDNATTEVGYEIQAQKGDIAALGSESPAQDKAFELIATTDANATARVIADLDPYTLYTFRVRAIGAGGESAFSNLAVASTFPTDTSALEAPSELLVIPTSRDSVQLTWQDNSANELEFQVDMAREGGPFERVGTAPRDRVYLEVGGLEPGVRYTFRVRARGNQQFSPFSATADIVLPTDGQACVEAGDTACLLNDRFRIEVTWRNPRNGQTGQGNAQALSDQAATFWFFQEDNTELIVKMIDGRVNNGNFWVFYGALSDVEYWVTVTDTVTGEIKTYYNEFGNICGLADTRALSGDGNGLLTGAQVPAEWVTGLSSSIQGTAIQGTAIQGTAIQGTAAKGTADKDGALCGGDANSLCLLNNRVRVDVLFAAQNGQAGPAAPIPSTERSGLFWFFQETNPELVVKALDGTQNNGHIWIFWGALTNVEYRITVTDLVTGVTKTYINEQDNVCGGADIRALPVN